MCEPYHNGGRRVVCCAVLWCAGQGRCRGGGKIAARGTEGRAPGARAGAFFSSENRGTTTRVPLVSDFLQHSMPCNPHFPSGGRFDRFQKIRLIKSERLKHKAAGKAGLNGFMRKTV